MWAKIGKMGGFSGQDLHNGNALHRNLLSLYHFLSNTPLENGH